MDVTVLHATGSVLLLIWGIAYLFATKPVVAAMGDLSEEGGKIAVGLWIVEGFALIFIAAQMLALILVFGGDSYTVLWVARLSAAALVVLAVISLLTSARTAILPMKACPAVKLVAAGFYVAGNLLF